MKTVWREVADRFGAPDRAGAAGYAAQTALADPTEDGFQKRQDPVAAVKEFMKILPNRRSSSAMGSGRTVNSGGLT
jgi:hypothetical protein